MNQYVTPAIANTIAPLDQITPYVRSGAMNAAAINEDGIFESVYCAYVVMALEYDRNLARRESRFVDDVAGYFQEVNRRDIPYVSYSHDLLRYLYGRYGGGRVQAWLEAQFAAQQRAADRFR